MGYSGLASGRVLYDLAVSGLWFVQRGDEVCMAILEVKGLVKYYGSRKVVDQVDFQVDVGEVVGLLGSNGAGKTTSFRMATGQVPPNAGRVIFNGKDVTRLQMYKRAQEGMGYLSQETSVFRKLTVEQNILAILEAMPFYRTLKRRLKRAERYQKTHEVLEKFGLSHLRKNSAARLSGGERRRLEIARCLVADPLLILLDEPFTGIDPQTIDEIKEIVGDLRNQGIGILVTDHQVEKVLDITDRSYLIKGGKVLTHGTPRQLVNDPVAIKAYFSKDISRRYGGDEHDRREGVYGRSDGTRAAAEETIQRVTEQEIIRRLVEQLRGPEANQAGGELLQRSRLAVPALLEALERRDEEMRAHAFEVLQRILGLELAFEPFAPEPQRRQQLAALRERLLPAAA
jgi:lipopolysaccharide export system ATP-binding protein